MVTMDQARSVTATFTLVEHTLTVSKAGSGSGSVASSPAGIDCGGTCSASFTEGTIVTLTAVAAAGSTFTGWGGDCTGLSTCMVTMDQARSVTATFTLVSGQPTPRALKEAALASLRLLLPTADKKEAKKIQDAIESLEKSLAPKLWADDSHLNEKSEEVFRKEKEAVDKLGDIKNPSPTITSVIDALVAADQLLARTAIDEERAAGGDAKKLADAEKEMEKAADEMAKGHPDKAIQHYEKAWKKAGKA